MIEQSWICNHCKHNCKKIVDGCTEYEEIEIIPLPLPELPDP